ncbi:MAG: hypothetical protein ACMXYA_02410 [Candidatus Woesearchaeota archaeon]
MTMALFGFFRGRQSRKQGTKILNDIVYYIEKLMREDIEEYQKAHTYLEQIKSAQHNA